MDAWRRPHEEGAVWSVHEARGSDMTETVSPSGQPAPVKPRSRIWGYISAGATFIVAAIALIRLLDSSLPGCLSTTANTTASRSPSPPACSG